MSQTSEYRARITTVQRWLKESGWTVADSATNPPAIVERAAAEWYPGRGAEGRKRAAILVAKAARLLRGEVRSISVGRPVSTVTLEIGEVVTVSLVHPEGRELMTRYTLTAVDGKRRGQKWIDLTEIKTAPPD